jgi:pimeloyl-ACP methyl ester carboxylesterase
MSDEVRIRLYHEVHGGTDGRTTPLLLVHGGGSTIGTSFGALLPQLTASRPVVAVELQGHGHTPSTDRPFTFENSADDVAALLGELGLGPVDVLGFSNGGNVAMRLAMRHPALVRRLVLCSAFYRRDGMVDGFWDGLRNATVEDMPQVYLDADAAINPDRAHQEQLFELDSALMKGFLDWADEELVAVATPTLVVAGDQDVMRPEHSLAMARLIPGARLLILPAGHGDYLGELLASDGDLTAMHATLPWILRFLDENS